MLLLFIRFFFPKKGLKSLTKRSDQIFSVFTQTQKDCESLNNEIDAVVTSKQVEIDKLQEEVDGLKGVKAKNSLLASKVTAFLNS